MQEKVIAKELKTIRKQLKTMSQFLVILINNFIPEFEDTQGLEVSEEEIKPEDYLIEPKKYIS